eukprot:m.20130 g.20130  ORF g.20130 m.20130 type:complete len:64 (-) comp12746_c0_seq2:50-241(-)
MVDSYRISTCRAKAQLHKNCERPTNNYICRFLTTCTISLAPTTTIPTNTNQQVTTTAHIIYNS